MNKEKQKRAEALYFALVGNPGHWFTQKEICSTLKGYKYTDRKNDRCPSIRADMLTINEDQKYKNIIIMKDYKFKIATNHEELLYFYASHIRRLKNQVKILKDLERKLINAEVYEISENAEDEIKKMKELIKYEKTKLFGPLED